MGGPALRCAAGKSNRARCFQRVALSTAPFFLRRDFRARCASREPLKQLRRELFVRASGERFARRAFVRHHSRAAASNGASVRKSGRRTPSARVSRVARTAPSRATFARHWRIAAVHAAGGCRRRHGQRAPWRRRARSACSPAEASCSWKIRGSRPGGRPRHGRRAPWRRRARSACSPAEASCSWRIRGRGRPEAPPSRRRRWPPRWCGLSL